MKLVSLLRPFISYNGKLSPPPLILGPVGPPWESEIILGVVCKLEVALFAALPRQSIREKEALSVLPCPFLFGRPTENPSGLPLVGISLPRLMGFTSSIDKLVPVLCFRSNQKKPRNRKR